MARERKDLLVRMPAELKRRLVDEVEAGEGNLNDLAVGILASRFAVPFQPSGRRASAPSASGDVLLRVPPELKDKLSQRARERKRTLNQLVVETLEGSTYFAKQSGDHPAVLRNMVTSPGGTSAAAIYELEKGRIRTVFSDAVWAAYRRTLELGERLEQDVSG